MPKKEEDEQESESIETEEIEYEEVKFGYAASIVFLIFIALVIYVSWEK